MSGERTQRQRRSVEAACMCESHQDTPRRMRAGPTKKALAKRSSTCTNELAQGTALLNLALKMTHRDWIRYVAGRY